MKRSWTTCGLALAVSFACSSSEGSGDPVSDAAAEGATACDPRPGSDAGRSDAGSGGGGFIGEPDGGIDLTDGGSPMPRGRLKCFDPNTGAGFDCEMFGEQCCTKKDVCFDVAAEPTFCDRPYCK
jgi:hypothetical protein